MFFVQLVFLHILSVIVIFKFDSVTSAATTGDRSFTIDYANDRFLKDGKPYRYISGSIHYFRVPSAYWDDRLGKMKAAGLNAIEFYIPWNMHELSPGRFDFASESTNVTQFLGKAQQHGLDVILRMGPYTCGELDNGGLPWWLMKLEPEMNQRTNDTRFLYYVTRWYFKLFPMIVPFLYKNGGPVIMIQVENEYGSYYACDRGYMTYLRDLFRSYVGDDVVLFTVDGGALSYLKCGFTPGLYPTVDFGTGNRGSISLSFAAQRTYSSHGPLVNSEFYPGWLDLWGLNHSTLPTAPITTSMRYMYEFGASFNFYMFHGGTTFGYWNGAVGNRPCITSYDYDSPLDEAGDPTDKYVQIRSTIENLTRVANPHPIPKPTPKRSYGSIETALVGPLVDLLRVWQDRKVVAQYPPTFEQISYGYGFLLYVTTLPPPAAAADAESESGGNLSIPGIRDRGYVMLDGRLQGIVSNLDKTYQVTLRGGKIGQKLQILVENQGRHTQGPPEQKGLVSNVTLDGRVLSDWTIYPIDVQDLFTPLKWDKPQRSIKEIIKSGGDPINPADSAAAFTPSFYYAKFVLPNGQQQQQEEGLQDTFFHPGNWSKGQLFLNEFNVGRYWPTLGPQVTLYVPKTLLKPGINYAVILELEKPGNCVDEGMTKCSFRFVDRPILDKVVYPQGEILASDRKDYAQS